MARPWAYPRALPFSKPSLKPSLLPFSLARATSFSSKSPRMVVLALAASSSAAFLSASRAATISWALKISLWARSSWALYKLSSSLARERSLRACTRASLTLTMRERIDLAWRSASSARCFSYLCCSVACRRDRLSSRDSCSSWSKRRRISRLDVDERRFDWSWSLPDTRRLLITLEVELSIGRSSHQNTAALHCQTSTYCLL